LCIAGDATAYVAVYQGALVGFCTVYLDVDTIRMGQRAWLNELAVEPNHRGRGLGRRLLNQAIDWARDHGATYLVLDSSVARPEAHRFYRRAQPSFEAACFGWIF
jgi:GNAT superfamily N-acetyltransferase